MFDLFNILIRYAFAFITVCIFCPVIVFSKVGDNKLESFFANFSRIVFTLIIAGYILVFIKLFELIVLISIVAIFAARKVIFIKFYKSDRNIRKELKLWAYDYSDGLIKLSKLLGSRLTLWKNDLKDRFVSFFKNQHYNIISLSLIFIYSGWMRFYDVIINAAPAMSDAYVTLAWIKYINRRILFHDGIYPMGFHIYQAVLHKFSAMDPLFILKITGPLNSILIILGIYFLVSRLLKNIQAGIAAAAIYGVFNVYLANDVERQVATNSQEFAFVFILPCIWFLYKYIVNRDKNDLYAAGAALAVIGLVHTLAIAFVLLITSILILALLVTNARVFRETFLKILLTGATAFFISMVPLGLGLLSGKSFHGTSLDFATAQASYIEYPKLMLPDYMTVASLFLLALNLVTDKDKQTRTARLFILLSGGSIFAIYYYGAVLTGNALIASRSGDLYSLISPITIGAGLYVILRFLSKIRIPNKVHSIACLCALLTIILIFRPEPIIPYKMEYNSNVEQYIIISRNYKSSDWLIVSQEEGYALSLGMGWHMMVQDFLKNYSPDNGNLLGEDSGDSKINNSDVFIFVEKEVYKTYDERPSLKTQFMRRQEEKDELQKWIETYMEKQKNIDLFYEDIDIVVYHIFKTTELSAVNLSLHD